MSLDLNQCNSICHNCVKQYICKHQLKKGDQFEIAGCDGIPLKYIPDDIIASLGTDSEMANAMKDPVLWANKFLDWHCIDPFGEHWMRKTKAGSLAGLPPYKPQDPESVYRAKNGKSIFHRPYQEEMLRCSSKRKIFRIGRQSGKTETLCVMIVFNLFTSENFKIEVITPYQSQIDLIFKRVGEMIDANPMLRNSVHRNVKAPTYTIELKNKSQVIGFTAGTRSKQEAGASRGQTANMLVFDEADFLSPKDIDAALAVIINYPDATVWMSSTPTGRREKFYESCKNKQYREFHFPSTVNPNWSEKLEAFFRSELTEDGYKHEIMADFGEQEEGVYQLKYIEAAQSAWEYSDMKPQPTWSYMIGVDWNDIKIGTTIAVVGFNPQDNQFYLVEKHVISRGNRTQLAACQKVAEVNRLWNASYIYVDQGFGTTQIEVLHDYGQNCLKTHGPNHPDARLRNIVKGYDFGSNIEIHDLFTKQPVKKPAKPFLVENSVRRFENIQFKYPESDEHYTKQLLGYIVDRVSASGRPVYKQQNEDVGDHFLDAVNLALVAFALEKSSFGKPIYSQHIAVTNAFGNKTFSAETMVNESKNHRPKPGRSDNMKTGNKLFGDINGKLPAANTNRETFVKTWSWPGFGTDEPRPVARSAQQRNTEPTVLQRRSRRERPRRAKF